MRSARWWRSSRETLVCIYSCAGAALTQKSTPLVFAKPPGVSSAVGASAQHVLGNATTSNGSEDGGTTIPPRTAES